MIDPTNDMIDAYESARRAYWEAMDHTAEVLSVKEHGRAANRAGLAAAFELVERDYDVRPARQNHPPCGIEGPDGMHCERNPHTPASRHGALGDNGLVRW